MIKRGMFGMDDYIKFGGMLDTFEKLGAVLIVYSPKRGTVTAVIKRKNLKSFKAVAGTKIKSIKVHGGMAYITVRVWT